MKFTLTSLSICPCGETALKDEIPLGTVYEGKGLILTINYICGKCGFRQRVPAIYAARPGTGPGFIPYGLFCPPPIKQEVTRN